MQASRVQGKARKPVARAMAATTPRAARPVASAGPAVRTGDGAVAEVGVRTGVRGQKAVKKAHS